MLAAIAFALLAPTQGPTEDPGPSLALRVNHAIARGVDYLRGQALPDGSYALHGDAHPGGATALVALALVEAGVLRSDPTLARALDALAGRRFESVYSASVHLMLCEALPRSETGREAAQASLDFLVEHQTRGVWAYPWSHLCMSNTQFALMALRAAARVGLEVPEETLVDAVKGLRMFQDPAGGFFYAEGGRANSSMTAAALAGFAALEELAPDSRRLRAELKKAAKRRAAAEEWLGARFDPTRAHFENGAWTPFWSLAYMWALERWCGLSARESFAGRDWYREGAEWLLETQAADGSWTSQDHPLENTCFALLFLRRATVSSGGAPGEVDAAAARAFEGRPDTDPRPDPEARRLVDWWLAGPWQGKADGALLLEPPFRIAAVEPGPRAKLARRPWKRVALRADRWTDLESLAGAPSDLSLWCLVTDLRHRPPATERTPLELVLWLELEDGWDVLLDGERLSRERRVQAAMNGDVRIPLRLAPGDHRLVLLVEDVGGAAAFGALLSAAAGGPPPAALEVGAVLEPEDGR